MPTVLQTIETLPGDAHYCIAYSGGLDSTVLLHAAARVLPMGQVRALHIHHGLSPHADQWQRHCEQTCAGLGLPIAVERVQIDFSGKGLEEAARRARYRAFEQQLAPGEQLLLAHHADDQLETLLLRLTRGAGPDGLGAMPASRPLGAGSLQRPLLALSRQQLEDWARNQGLSWIDDESNQETGLDRNYLRHRVLPALTGRWPELVANAGVSSALCRDSTSLLAEYAREDIDRLCVEPAWPETAPALSIPGLRRLGPARQQQILRVWLIDRGRPAPPRQRLLEARTQLIDGEADTGARIEWDGYCLRRYRDGLYCLAARTGSLPARPVDLPPLEDRGERLEVSLPGSGRLVIEPASAGAHRLRRGLSGLSVSWRHGGERCRPAGRAHSQTLKKLLQAGGVPPWWRERLPLVYAGEQLVALPGLWVCEGFQAGEGEAGYRLGWNPDRLGCD